MIMALVFTAVVGLALFGAVFLSRREESDKQDKGRRDE